MIPENLKTKWELVLGRTELLFLADHGGYPDALSQPGATPASRRVALGQLGFRIRQEYMMPDDNLEYTVPWCRLTNVVAVCLSDGFVVRSTDGGDRNGRGQH